MSPAREPGFLNVSEARLRARRVLPRVLFDYVDGGAEDETTMRSNQEAFGDYVFGPRMATGSIDADVGVRLFGETLNMPVILAPCGLVRLMHPDGAGGAARGAASQGTISVLSAVAGVPLEEVARATTGPQWFQLYTARGRSEAGELTDRARDAGFKALVVTVDTPVIGRRERDVRHGVEPPLRITPSGVVHLGPQILSKPGWAWSMARQGLSMFARAEKRGPSVVDVRSVGSPYSWSDVEWVRQRWSGPLLVKGILSATDARTAIGCGCDGIVVSNHGGRQLECAPATLRVLPEIAQAVGGEAEVLLDGGVRRGSDVAKAVALGARAVLIGRPYMYGLAAGGQAGVEQVLRILREELKRSLTLMGCGSLAELDPGWVRPAR
jgi:isopentenyl diphosphate isomerase/L-lactate dehydrogenase-like FMN-dependent dehydrogenase